MANENIKLKEQTKSLRENCYSLEEFREELSRKHAISQKFIRILLEKLKESDSIMENINSEFQKMVVEHDGRKLETSNGKKDKKDNFDIKVTDSSGNLNARKIGVIPAFNFFGSNGNDLNNFKQNSSPSLPRLGKAPQNIPEVKLSLTNIPTFNYIAASKSTNLSGSASKIGASSIPEVKLFGSSGLGRVASTGKVQRAPAESNRMFATIAVQGPSNESLKSQNSSAASLK